MKKARAGTIQACSFRQPVLRSTYAVKGRDQGHTS